MLCKMQVTKKAISLTAVQHNDKVLKFVENQKYVYTGYNHCLMR